MRIGVMTGTGFDPDPTLAGMIDNARHIESLGFDSLWMATIYNYDALTALAAIGSTTSRIELGTCVVATHPRHPMSMAQQALTASAACGGRFTLGIGLSHRYVIEQEMGLSYAQPAAHMREYLEVLVPLLRDGNVNHKGDRYSVNAAIDVPDAPTPPLLVAALGPAMLELAGARADGTTLWLTGPKTIAQHTVPTLTAAAARVGKPPPRVVAGMPVMLTDDVEQARAVIDAKLALYRDIPSYRAMLDREGADGPGDVALVGDADALRDQIAQLAAFGVTDLNAVLVHDHSDQYRRSLDFLAGELAGANTA